MALGRGLESLIKNNPIARENKDTLVELELDLIRPNPEQPRKSFDPEGINELAQSIKTNGLLEPIIVKKDGQYYTIIAGERRFRAVKQLGEKTIPAIIKNDINNILELSILENLQREDLNIVELANGYSLLISLSGYTHQELADRLGVSRASISNTMRILNLSEEVLLLLLNNKLSYGQARPLLAVKDKDSQTNIAHEIIKKDLSARQVERLIQKRFKEKPSEPETKDEEVFVGEVNNWLSEKYDTNVSIRMKNDKGKVEFKFNSLDQLNTLIKALGYSDDII